ncbi:MAG TPA: hypothetical protein VLE95_01645 [Chlamydiales bacterium]|nr:hypothetical protein [Chlamydiales bacterium]
MNPISDPSDASPLGSEPTGAQEQVHKSGSALQEFSEKLAAFTTPEEKVSFGLQFMRDSISQEGSPRFREFWEIRRLILPVFKENLNPAIRSKLWNEYVELTIEARRLKEILEEQSAFAMEQIDLAIQSIEADVSNFAALISSGSFSFPGHCDTISAKQDVYRIIQQELNLLNTLASRLNALRKEVVKTDMRIRFKAKFFKRLAELGDKVFPRRKELIEKVSSEFENDVDCFVSKHFKENETIGAPYYMLREKIKSLQSMAKLFTLSSGAFNRTRLKLSECWDCVRSLEKEHKKEVLEKKQASFEQRSAIATKIEELQSKSSDMSLGDLDKEIDLISKEMRMTPLHQDDVRHLRDELMKLRAPHVAAQEQKARELEEAEKEAIRIKKEKVARIKEEMNSLHQDGPDLTLDAFLSRFAEIGHDVESLEISKIEKQQLERLLRPLKDLLADKKEQSLLNLSDDDRKTLENLKTILKQKKERRQEIKETLEMHRKMIGASGLDFEKAIQLRELIDQEKERLEKANAGIQEIEDKIGKLEF